MVRVKICGITNLEDALAATELGADMIGLVFAKSSRQISPELARQIAAALPSAVITVGVFMNQTYAEVEDLSEFVRLGMIQLHGEESPRYCKRLARRWGIIKRIPVQDNDNAATLEAQMQRFRVSAFLFDPGAGSGRVFDWRIAKGVRRPFIVAGGLTPENVRSLIHELNPMGVDVSSGVEKATGKKDSEKMRRFILEVR